MKLRIVRNVTVVVDGEGDPVALDNFYFDEERKLIMQSWIQDNDHDHVLLAVNRAIASGAETVEIGDD